MAEPKNPANLPAAQDVLGAISSDNLMGSGSTHSAYRIPGFPHLIVRLPTRLVRNGAKPELGTAVEITDPFPGRNFGQAIVSYGQGITVSHLQPGVAIGVPNQLARDFTKRAEADLQYARQTSMIANMPQRAYVDLLSDIQTIEAGSHRIDPSKPGNLLVDASAQRFNFVDITLAPESSKGKLGELGTMLLDTVYGHNYHKRADYKSRPSVSDIESIYPARRMILDKLITAAELKGIPFEIDSSAANCLEMAGYTKDSPGRISIEERIRAIPETFAQLHKSQTPPTEEAPKGKTATKRSGGRQGSFVTNEVSPGTTIKTGILLGATSAGIAAAMHAHEGAGAAFNAAQEAILPGSTTAGTDICKITGTIAGGTAGTLAAGAVGVATFAGTTTASAPVVGPAAPIVGGVTAFAAMGVTYNVTQPAAQKVTESVCNVLVPDSVKSAVSEALGALDSMLSFSGDDKSAKPATKPKNHIRSNMHR